MNDKQTLIKLQALDQTDPWEWGPGTEDFLLGVLQGDFSDPDGLLLAAHLAGNYVVVNDELVDALLDILGDSKAPEELRGTAAISLGPALEDADMNELDDPDEYDDCCISPQMFRKTCKTLASLYRDADIPKLVRRRILEAAVRSPQSWQKDAIRAAYASGDEDWVMTAVFCMGYVKGFEREILAALNSPNPDIHLHAVEAAGNWELDAAWPHVEGLLTSKDTDRELLMFAMDAAAQIKPRLAGKLIKPFAQSKDEEIADAALEALEAIRCALNSDSNDNGRTW